IRSRRTGQRACAHFVRALQSSQDRSLVQGLCTGGAGGVLARQANGAIASEYQGVTVIAIVDYKAGNLASVKKAFDHLGANTKVTDDSQIVSKADKIVLPGVGHFAATRALG